MHFPWIDVGDVRHLYSINEGKASKRFSTVQTFSLPLGILTQLNFTARLAFAQQQKTGLPHYISGPALHKKSELSAKGAEYESQGQAPKARNMKAGFSAKGAEYESQGQA